MPVLSTSPMTATSSISPLLVRRATSGLRTLIFGVGFLSTKLESLKAASGVTAGRTTAVREAGTSKTSAAAAAATESTTSVHHAEENFGVDSTHASSHSAAGEHIGRIDEIFAAVITCSLSVETD